MPSIVTRAVGGEGRNERLREDTHQKLAKAQIPLTHGIYIISTTN